MKVLKSIFLIINYKTFIVTILAMASTYACDYFLLRADFPLTIVGIAIVFPVVFSIDSAYKRREKALNELGNFKAHLLSIYYASRHWVATKDVDFQRKVKQELIVLFSSLRVFFTDDTTDLKEDEKQMFRELEKTSMLIQDFRDMGMQSGEISRVSQFISKLSTSIENLKVILHYRTPVTLRAYSKVFIYSFPILYGPYFSYVGEQYANELHYVMPIMFSFILVSLDNIQDHLENPFDQVGEDDIKFEVEEFSSMID